MTLLLWEGWSSSCQCGVTEWVSLHQSKMRACSEPSGDASKLQWSYSFQTHMPSELSSSSSIASLRLIACWTFLLMMSLHHNYVESSLERCADWSHVWLHRKVVQEPLKRVAIGLKRVATGHRLQGGQILVLRCLPWVALLCCGNLFDTMTPYLLHPPGTLRILVMLFWGVDCGIFGGQSRLVSCDFCRFRLY